MDKDRKNNPISDDIRGEKDLQQKGFKELDIGLLLGRMPMEIHKQVAEQYRINEEMRWGFRVFISEDKKLLVTVPSKNLWVNKFEDLQVGYFDLQQPLDL